MKPTSNDTRTELLHAALKCFATQGFDGTSMRLIAAEANRPISLFSHHFENKEGLYLAVFEWILAEVLPGIAKIPNPESSAVPKDQVEAVLMLREQVHNLYLESSQNIHLHDAVQEAASKLLLHEIRAPRPSLHPLLLRYFQCRLRLIGLCIATIHPEFDESRIAFLADSIIGAITGHGLFHGLSEIIWKVPKGTGTHFQDAEFSWTFACMD